MVMNQFATFAAGLLSLTLLSAAPVQNNERQANAAEQSLLVIDHSGYADGRYLLQLDKSGDTVKLSRLVLNVVDLDGRPVGDVPDKPDKPDPELSLLDQVRNNFGADQELFESQLTGLIKALDLSRSEGLTQKQLNVYVQGKMEIAFGDYAHNWKPWTDWFLPTAVRKTSLEDYKAWVEEAAESLVAHCDSGFAEVM